MNSAQTALKSVSSALLKVLDNLSRLSDQKTRESFERRKTKARALYRRALDIDDQGVKLSFGMKDGKLVSKLRIVSDTQVNPRNGNEVVHFASITEEGEHTCSCQDHQNKGVLCKHLTCLAGLTKMYTGILD